MAGEVSVDTIVTLLKEVLANPSGRQAVVHKICGLIGEQNPLPEEEHLWIEVLDDLNYDLSLYEPDPVMRAEDRSFKDDLGLIAEVHEGLAKLAKLGVRV